MYKYLLVRTIPYLNDHDLLFQFIRTAVAMWQPRMECRMSLKTMCNSLTVEFHMVYSNGKLSRLRHPADHASGLLALSPRQSLAAHQSCNALWYLGFNQWMQVVKNFN